jgi:ABC-2 type transport system permease protein
MSVMTMNKASTPPSTAPAGRYGMVDLIRSEWTKLRTVRSTMWTLGATIVVGIGISALATAEVRAHLATTGPFDPTRLSLTGTFFCQLVIGVLGVLVVSGEYGTGTIRATFAAAPRRPPVLFAKVLVFGTVVVVISEVDSFLSFLLGQALLTSPAPHASFSTPGALTAVVGTGLYLCVIGLFALALATLIRHTAGAISAFVFLLLVLPLIVEALPTSMQNAVNRYELPEIGSRILNATNHGARLAFSPWAGFGVLCGYTFALLVVSGFLLVRRDA